MFLWTQYLQTKVFRSLTDRVCQWVSDSVTDSLWSLTCSHWVCESLTCVSHTRVWVSEWVSQWVSEWVSELVDIPYLQTSLTYMDFLLTDCTSFLKLYTDHCSWRGCSLVSRMQPTNTHELVKSTSPCFLIIPTTRRTHSLTHSLTHWHTLSSTLQPLSGWVLVVGNPLTHYEWWWCQLTHCRHSDPRP